MYFSSKDTITLHRLREIETRSSPDSLAAAHRGFTFYVADPISSIETRSCPDSLAAVHRGFTFCVADPHQLHCNGADSVESCTANERTCDRSKFESQEDHFGASHARRGFHAVTDRRRCDESDLLRGENSSARGCPGVLGHLSGSRIFCALLRDCLCPTATGTSAAERDIRAEARSVFAGITLPPGE